MKLSLALLYQKKYFATLLLLAFTTFYLMLDINLISPFKVGLMSICLFLQLGLISHISRPFVYGVFYIMCVMLCTSLYPTTFRYSTLVYLTMHLLTYLTFYTLLYQNIWDWNYAMKVIKGLICAYIIFFILQQLFLAVGIRTFWLLNLSGEPYLEVFKTNSLALEPSHSARIMTVAFYAWLKLLEFKNGSKETISSLYHNYRWFFLGFLYLMIAMGSSTAIIGLLILSLYFVKKKNLILVPIAIFVLSSILKNIEFKQAERALSVMQAIPTMDQHTIQEADGSAYFRVAPLINTVKDANIFDETFWIGNGIDNAMQDGKDGLVNYSMIGNIRDYGFFSFIFLLLFIYSSAIKHFFSLETLIFVILMAATLGNAYYPWGIMMLFTIIRYFDENRSLFQNRIRIS